MQTTSPSPAHHLQEVAAAKQQGPGRSLKQGYCDNACVLARLKRCWSRIISLSTRLGWSKASVALGRSKEAGVFKAIENYLK